MITPNPIERDRILLRLDTFRFVAEANIELFEENPRLKERFEESIQTVQDFVHELDVYEQSGDLLHYASALDSAELALERVHDLINDILK